MTSCITCICPKHNLEGAVRSRPFQRDLPLPRDLAPAGTVSAVAKNLDCARPALWHYTLPPKILASKGMDCQDY